MTTNIEKFVSALVGPIQVLEDTLGQVLLGRMLDNAVGVQLDAIGKVVGRPRNGLSADDQYRRVIRAQIATNKSDGRTEDLITICTLVVDDGAATYAVINEFNANVAVLVEDVSLDYPVALILVSLLRRAKLAGVRLVLEFHTLVASATFCFAGGPGLGWGDETDPSKGGGWASALE